jgi:hypothetical protein
LILEAIQTTWSDHKSWHSCPKRGLIGDGW